jgi:MFS family permease
MLYWPREQAGQEIQSLGLLIIAAGLASSLSAPFWGRFSDKSSRQVMIAASMVAMDLGILVFLFVSADLPLLQNQYVFAALFFTIGIAHSGVRLGRKTYLVDMATPEKRSFWILVLFNGFGIFFRLISTSYICILQN